MLSINLRDSVDSFIKTLNANGKDSEVIFTSSSDSSIVRGLGDRISFWKRVSNSDPFDRLAITPKVISQSIKSVCNYLKSKYPDDLDITNITSRLTTEFYNSVRGFNDKKLADLMVVFFNHFAMIINLLENSSDADLERNKEKVKNNLMIFPGISANQVDFACIEGTSVRIQEASLAVQKLPIDQQLYQDHVSSLVAKLINQEFPKSSVLNINQIHLGAFFHSLFTLNHQHLDRFYRVPDPRISLYDVLEITREFKSMIKKRVGQLTQEIASDADLTTKSFYLESQEHPETVIANSLVQYLETIKEKYGIELNIYDLMKDENDPENFTEDDSQIFKNKLKTSLEIKQLILQKLVEKFPQLSLVQDQAIEISSLPLLETSDNPSQELPLLQSSQVSDQQDQFDFLAHLDIQRDAEGDRDLSLDPKKIDDILALLFPTDANDLNKSQKIKAGLLITHILARDLKNQDPIFFMALYQKIIDRINETLSDETSQKISNLKDSFEHFSRSLSQSLTQEDQIGLTNLLAYLDAKYIDYKRLYFGNDLTTVSMLETYLKIYMSSKDNPLNLTEEQYQTLLSNHQNFFVIALRLNHNNFFISLLDLLKTYHGINPDDLSATLEQQEKLQRYKNLIKDLFTTKNNQDKNAIETAVEVSNFRLFMIMLNALDQQQITETLADQNTFTAIANGIYLCYQQNQFDFIKNFIDKIFLNEADNRLKITLLLQRQIEEGNNLLHILSRDGKDQIIEAILSKVTDDNKKLLLESKNICHSTPLHLACQNGHVNVIEKIFASLDDDKKIELLSQKNYLNYTTPFHLACQNGHVNVIEKIFASLDDDKKIELLSQKNYLCYTPLHIACQNGQVNVIEKILASVDDNKKIKLLKQKNNAGFTPLYIACETGHADVVEKIFASLDGNKKMKLIQMGTWNFFSLFNFGFRPLLVACKKGRGLVIEKMLEALEIDQRINFLIKNGSSIQAITFGDHDSIKRLICCMINIIKEKPESSLDRNFFKTFANLIKKLPETELEFLANLFCNNTQNGFSILHDASSKSNNQLLDLIVDTVKKITRENTEVLDLLINKETHNDQDSSNLNPDLDGKTPLYFAVKNLFSNDDSKTNQQTQKELKIIKKLLANILTIDQKTKHLVLEKLDHKNFKSFRDILEKSNIDHQEKNFINSRLSVNRVSSVISRSITELSHRRLNHIERPSNRCAIM